MNKSKEPRHHFNMIKHGGYSKDPLQVLKSWKRHNPALAKEVDRLFRSYSRHLPPLPLDPFMPKGYDSRKKHLKTLCIRMVTRNVLLAIIHEKDYTRYIESLGKSRPHNLIFLSMKIDLEIQQQLKDLCLLAP